MQAIGRSKDFDVGVIFWTNICSVEYSWIATHRYWQVCIVQSVYVELSIHIYSIVYRNWNTTEMEYYCPAKLSANNLMDSVSSSEQFHYQVVGYQNVECYSNIFRRFINIQGTVMAYLKNSQFACTLCIYLHFLTRSAAAKVAEGKSLFRISTRQLIFSESTSVMREFVSSWLSEKKKKKQWFLSYLS